MPLEYIFYYMESYGSTGGRGLRCLFLNETENTENQLVKPTPPDEDEIELIR